MAYLGVIEASTTITVESGPVGGPFDWKIVFDSGYGGAIMEWYQDGGSSDLGAPVYFSEFMITHSNGDRRQINDPNAVMVLKENTPNRTQIHISGNLEAISAYPYISIVTVYPSGYITFDFSYEYEGALDVPNRVSISTDQTNYPSAIRHSDPTAFPDKFFFGQSHVGLDSAITYIINTTLDFTSYATGGSGGGLYQTFRNDIGYTFNSEQPYMLNYYLYIGGQANNVADIEADGIFLLDWALE